MSQNSDFLMTPHVPLEWSSSQQQVVAKQSLVGLSWKSLAAFSTGRSQRLNKDLADVLEVPDGVFSLKDLQQVLSYEAWTSCLSELEKGFLCRYLPEGCDIEENLTSLLGGENFFFGNPLVQWGERVCSGDMHPDLIVRQQTAIHIERKSYCLSLQMYHQMMIRNLHHLKDIWRTCKTREKIHLESERWTRSRKPASWSLQHINGGTGQDVPGIVYPRQRLKRPREPALDVEVASSECLKTGVNGEINGEISIPDVRTITVTRKQFAEIASRRLTGTELRLDTLKDLLSTSTRLETKDDFCKSYWRTLAVRDLPEIYTAFRERFERRKELAIVLARQCMHRCSKFEENLSVAVTAKTKVCSRSLPEKPISLAKVDTGSSNVTSHSLLYYQRVGVPTEDDELASIQELWSYNCLQDAPIHL